MSIEVELTIMDYNNLLGWFTKAFGGKDDAKPSDKQTYQKIAVMATQHVEDEKFIQDMKDE